MPLVSPLTIDDFEKLPQEQVHYHELVDGELVDVSGNTFEIVSENDTFKRLVEKADRYRRCGTQEAWIFDIDSRRAFLFSEDGDAILNEDQHFKSSLIPGFFVRLGDLFDQL